MDVSKLCKTCTKEELAELSELWRREKARGMTWGKFETMFARSARAWRDLGGDGVQDISLDRLRAVLRAGGVVLTEVRTKELVAPFEKRSDERVDYIEFFDVFLAVAGDNNDVLSGDEVLRGEEVLRRAWQDRQERVLVSPADGEGTSLYMPADVDRVMRRSVIMSTVLPNVGAGALVRTMLAPLARVSLVSSVNPDLHWHTRHVYSDIMQLFRSGGTQSLWRGNALNVLKHGTYTASSVASYDTVHRALRRHELDQTLGSIPLKILSGAAAGLFGTCVSFPIDAVRTRYAAFVAPVTMAEAVRPRRFMHGLSVALLETVPTSIITLTCYDVIFTAVSQHRAHKEDVVVPALVAGMSAASLSTIVTYPLLSLRRNVQARPFDNVRTVARDMWRAHGLQTMYRGFSAHFLQVLPQHMLSFVLFERWRKSIQSEP